MDKIRQQTVAGVFYPENLDEAHMQLKFFEKNNNCDYEYKTRAIIVPHAGWVYSGQLASEGFECLKRDGIKNIFIFAPSHKVAVQGIALSSMDGWQTPLGKINVNKEICAELQRDFGAEFNIEFNDDAHLEEHSIEVQLPFIQSAWGDTAHSVKIIPILFGEIDPLKIAKIIKKYYQNPENAFVISSDLSHYQSLADANKIDLITALMIETGNTHNFDYAQSCGAAGILGLVEFARVNGCGLIRVGMLNSASAFSENFDENKKVVGYGAWMLYESDDAGLSFSNFIKEYFGGYVKALCKRGIQAELESKSTGQKETIDLGHIPPVLEQYAACFITLRLGKELRGCVGSIIPHRTFIEDLIHNSYSAAFEDERFEPLTAEEFKSEEFSLSVSILSTPEPISFVSEVDLLEKIVAGRDGIIIQQGDKQAVYLPSVWEELSDKCEFLNSLKQKAGLERDYFSQTLEVYRFRAISV